MKKHRRLIFWLVFFAVVAVLVAIPEFMEDKVAVVAPVVKPAAQSDLRLNSPTAPLAALRTDSSADVSSDSASDSVVEIDSAATQALQPTATGLFAAKTWVIPPPPPPPPPPEPPPPPPSAPPLPFKLIGKLDDNKTVKAFLQKGEQVYTVSVGDVIEGTYRVDSIKTGQMTLMYLPLSIPQTLSGGGES